MKKKNTKRIARRRRNLESYREAERIRQRRARAKTRIFVNSMKTKCSKCPKNHPACLHFHHRDPAIKVMKIQQAVTNKMPRDKLLEEIAKCDVLCANCHAKLHYNELK